MLLFQNEMDYKDQIDTEERRSILKLMRENEQNKQFISKAKKALEDIQKKPIFRKCVIRIKFPNNFMLQGEFGCKEKIVELYKFVEKVFITLEYCS